MSPALPPRFVTRAAWGARPAARSVSTDIHAELGGVALHWWGPATGIRAHADCPAKVRETQAEHIDRRGWDDIAYTALVCPHGYVFEGRGPGRRTAAQGTNDGNDRYYAICALVGQDEPFTDAARTATAAAIRWLRHTGAGHEIQPHHHFHPTACPGPAIDAWIGAGTPVPHTGTPTKPKEPTVTVVRRAIDVAWQRPTGAECVAAGITDVIGYISQVDEKKALPRDVIDDYLAHRVDVHLVYEDGTSDEFVPAQGHTDGAYCRDWLTTKIKAPAGMTIYRAIDTGSGSLPALRQHFAAFFSEIPHYRRGGYGDYQFLRDLLASRHIVDAWQTIAWSHHELLTGKACLYQDATTVQVGGHRYDSDQVWGPLHGWLEATGHPIAPATPPKPATVGLAPLAAYARTCAKHHVLLQYHGPKVPLDHGYAVKAVQLVVGAKPADSLYGPGTKAAVEAFQRAHHLTADGVVGPHTWAALEAAGYPHAA